MYRVGVIGDYDSIKGFAAVGLAIFSVSDAKEAGSKLKELAGGDYAIIYITEDLAAQMEQELFKYKEQMLPAVIPIPGIKGKTGFGMENIRKAAIRAIGSDITENSE